MNYEIIVKFSRELQDDLPLVQDNMVDEFGAVTLEKALIEQFRKELQSAYDMSDGDLAGLFSIIGLTETSKYDIKKAELEILRDHIDKELAELRNAKKAKKCKN